MNQDNILVGEAPLVFRRLSGKGFAWAAMLPGIGLLLFYGLVLSVRVALGRWPHFGEVLPTRALSHYYNGVFRSGGFFLGSLYAVPFLLLAILCFRRYRHTVVYVLAYALFVGLGMGLAALAPHEFLNWFFD